jgi:hypothetical protein
MAMYRRVFLCLALVALDGVVFFLPLTAFFLCYILLANPAWFRKFLNDLDPVNPAND